MSLARLFLSGVLIAGGLILGAFTLHGYLDPDWAQRRMMAAGAGPKPSEPPAIDPLTGRSRFVAGQGNQPSPSANPGSKTAAKSPSPSSPIQADAKTPAKPAAKKKVAEKTDKAEKSDKAKRPQQAASVGWPWNLFSN